MPKIVSAQGFIECKVKRIFLILVRKTNTIAAGCGERTSSSYQISRARKTTIPVATARTPNPT
jgi:hypothetical protein